MDTIDQFIEKFNNAVDFREQVELAGDTDLGTLPEWDSLAALGVIVMCDMEYEKTITGKDLAGCRTVAELYALVC